MATVPPSRRKFTFALRGAVPWGARLGGQAALSSLRADRSAPSTKTGQEREREGQLDTAGKRTGDKRGSKPVEANARSGADASNAHRRTLDTRCTPTRRELRRDAPRQALRSEYEKGCVLPVARPLDA